MSKTTPVNPTATTGFTVGEADMAVLEKLRGMRLPAMAARYKEILENPNSSARPYTDIVMDIVGSEDVSRRQKKTNRILKNSGLRYTDATLDELTRDPSRQLDLSMIEFINGGRFIEEHRPVLVTGPTGSGKTHIACAVAVTAATRGESILYDKANTFMHRCEVAEADGRYFELLNKMATYDLLILDDFGLMRMDMSHCRYLFEVLDARDGRASTIVISQFPVESWFDFFQDNTFADASLSRLTGRAYRLPMNGRDMRKPA